MRDLTTRLIRVKEGLDQEISRNNSQENLRALGLLGQQIVEGVREAISHIRVEPQVNVSSPNVDVRVPDVNVPEIKIPEIKIPEIKVPKAEVEVKIPPIKIPEIKIPKIKVPEIKVPKIEIPPIEVKTRDVSDIDRKHPLPVILTTRDGKVYAMSTMTGGGSSGKIYLKNKSDLIINPVGEATGLQIDTVTLTSADTTYSYVIPDRTLQMDIKLRVIGVDMLYSWSDWGDYMTIPAGGSRHIASVRLTGKTIYFRSGTGSQTVEIECFIE